MSIFLTAGVAKADADRFFAAVYPPLMIEDRETLPGISIEIIREAALRLDREITIEFAPYQRVMHVVQTQNDAMMLALYRNGSREEQFNWVVETHAAKVRFISIGKRIDTIEEARKLAQVGVETGSSADRHLTSLGFENLVRMVSPDRSARMLAVGRIDAWLLTATVANTIWEQLDLKQELIVGDVILNLPIFMVAGRDFPKDTAAIYKVAIEGLIADGTVATIIAKY